MDPVLEKIYSIKKSEIPDYARNLMLGGGTRGGPVLVRGKGCWVEDIDGKRYIDCTSQSWALYLGYANDAINTIVSEHLRNLSHVHQGFDTLSRFAMARKLAELAPKALDRVSFTVGGGPAVEAAMKIAVKNRPGAQEFICLYDSYHGTTLGTMGASWQSTMAGGKMMAPATYNRLTKQFIRVPNPYCYRCPLGLDEASCGLACAERLREVVRLHLSGDCCAFVAEPIMGEGGIIVPPAGYFKAVKEILDQEGILFIADEVQSGFGRSGKLFAIEHFGVTPDIMTMAKGIADGWPLGAFTARAEIADAFQVGDHLSTFGGNPVSCAASLANIAFMTETDLPGQAAVKGEKLMARLRAHAEHESLIGDVRGKGLMVGVELVKDRETKAYATAEAGFVRNYCLEHGLLIGVGGNFGNVLRLQPPLVISEAELDTVFATVAEAIEASRGAVA